MAKRVASKGLKRTAGKSAPSKPERATAKRSKPAPRRATTTASRNGTASATTRPAKPSAVSSPAPLNLAGQNGSGRFSETGERLRRSKLTASELAEFRDLLNAKRQELIGDMNHLRSEALGHGSSGEGSGASTMPIHMADIGSDTWEQELTLGLIEKERGILREIEEALDRIEDQTYGICLGTNKPISKARLRHKPWAKYCIEYARKRELGRY